MSLRHCLACTTRYAVGLPKCPHCNSTEYTDGPDRARNEPAATMATAKATTTKTPPPSGDS